MEIPVVSHVATQRLLPLRVRGEGEKNTKYTCNAQQTAGDLEQYHQPRITAARLSVQIFGKFRQLVDGRSAKRIGNN